MDTNPPLRRLTIAVDAESYSSRNRDGQHKLQSDLLEILRRACENGNLNRLEWDTQKQGDGELAILPPGTVEDRTISDFVNELDKALYHHNKALNDAYRVRLRVAVHQGNISVGDNGFAGKAAVTVCRMRDSDQVRAALANRPDSDLVLVVSESIYSDVIEEGTHALYRWRFDPIVIDEPAKDFRANAWVYVPDSAQPEPSSEPEEGVRPGTTPEPPTHQEAREERGPGDGQSASGRRDAPERAIYGGVRTESGAVVLGDHVDHRTHRS
ncbi:hypothetical protein [Halostreptopolyspora alba]|uniref:Guanylate cyclase domain-containing protein n=1 Tax=Halostreptopolyspora alba TaxID=2487137 RepID=A0A3N0ED29_9ACTN|nr:hypothetical protein EFW17_07265 [Nocardiopsaceae bacterium YIM 96095]